MRETGQVADDDSLTIDQLAQRTGMTVRNIRAHQSRGLLPAARGARTHRLLRAPSTSPASS